MKIKRPYIKMTGLLLLLLTTIFLAVGPLIPRIIDINTYQNQLVDILQDSLKRKISISRIDFAWRFGPEFVITDLHLREKDSDDEFLKAEKVTVRLHLLPLIRRKIMLKQIVVDGLNAKLIRNEEGLLNISDLLKPGKDGLDLHVRSIKLKRSNIAWLDNGLGDEKTELLLSDIDLSLDNLSRGRNGSFSITATLKDKTTSGLIKGSGNARIPKSDEDLLKATWLNANIEMKQIDFCKLWPYYGDKIPFGRPGGLMDLEGTFKGKLSDFSAKGMLKLHRTSVKWPLVFHWPVAPQLARLDFDMKMTADSIDIRTAHLAVDGFSIKGSVKLSDLNSKDPYFMASGVTDPFEYSNIRGYVPYGIIENDTSDFIENKIKAGRFKLDKGTLEGRFSKLARFTEGDNANSLFIYGTAEKAVVSYGQTVPSFNNVKGILELKGRNFNLHRMTGNFGNSPFSMSGSITEYSTMDRPSEYPFQMDITPRSTEVAWLARIAGADKLSFAGNSALRLNGDGPVKAFRLSGDWLLDQVSYQFKDAINKPNGMKNSLNFSALLSKRETRLTSLTYILPPLHLSAQASLRHGYDPPNLSFEIQTSNFHLGPQLPILINWQQYKPKGLVQAHIIGNGDPSDFSSMDYKGDIRLGDFSFKPLEKLPPVNSINGTIKFKGNSLETSSISVRYGNTPLTLKGRIAALKNPEADLYITSPELRPTDFGLSDEAQNISGFSTHLALSKDTLTVRNVTGHLKKSYFSAAGTIKPGPEPDINLRMASTYLDIEELLPFFAPKQKDTVNERKPGAPDPRPVSHFHLKAHIFAEAGSYRDIAFKGLSANLANEGGLLKMQSLDATMFGGRFSANGQLERKTAKPNRWMLSILLDRVKSDELLQGLGISRETSGLMTVKGDLNASGNSLDEIKQTARGNLSLKIERGVLRRFNSLSKVFSLLNISQILTFRIPDMTTEGTPFNQITATVSVRDGIITGQDFFIESNAMHISMVGKVDIVKEELDLLIGVQPLQTVDKIVSRIPIVGWILTGGDGSLITTYFEAKGKWSDPEVTAIPVKSMATGTFEIFRRVFELPVRLFTDSGEVLLGNQKERPMATQEK